MLGSNGCWGAALTLHGVRLFNKERRVSGTGVAIHLCTSGGLALRQGLDTLWSPWKGLILRQGLAILSGPQGHFPSSAPLLLASFL